MKIFAVVDTNVIVSALLSRNPEAATVKVLESFFRGNIVPMVNEEILQEYDNVLHRPKFHFPKELVSSIVHALDYGSIHVGRTHSTEKFPDPKDIVFYEVALSKKEAYLITGNTKHFPHTPIVVTPAEMVEILRTEDY